MDVGSLRRTLAKTGSLAWAVFVFASFLAACEAPRNDDLFLSESDSAGMEGVVVEHFDSAQTRLAEARSGSSKESALGRLCELHHAYQLTSNAVRCYERLVERSNEPRWTYLLGQVRLDSGDASGAREAFAEFFAQRPRHWSALALARAYAAEEQLQAAQSAYLEALSFERSAIALYELGQLEREQGELESAAAHFREAMEVEPEATVIARALAPTLRALGRDQEAESMVNRIGDGPVTWADPLLVQIRELRRGSQAAMERGVEMFDAGDFEGALTQFRIAYGVRAEPSVRVIRNLAQALLRTGESEEAVKLLQEAHIANPGNGDLAFELGVSLRGLGRLAQARGVWKSIDPPSLAVVSSLGALELQCRAGTAAYDHFQQALALSPALESALVGSVIALVFNGDFERARELGRSLDEAGYERARDLEFRVRVLDPNEAESVSQLVSSAERWMRERPSLFAMETVAFLLAQGSEFQRADDIQSNLVRAARDGGREALAERLAMDRDRYAAAEKSANPWSTFGVSFPQDETACH